ncbi:MAG: PIG-L family deacetylase [Alphaproteobacteria bacterium]|nr:PIG-L family deacetylase [Alphaproteobacteria bacterium]
MKKVLIIAPHPDDETLGAGGTLLKYKTNGAQTACVFVTSARKNKDFDAGFIAAREKEIKAVVAAYRFDKYYDLDFPAAKLTPNDTVALIKAIGDIIKDFEPTVVLLPFDKDVHSDHRIIFDAAWSCTKSFRYPSVKQVMMYETVSETDFATEEFHPDTFVDISDFIDEKMKILSIYDSQMGEPPFPRNYERVKALAVYRGGVFSMRYAEAFRLLKREETCV